MIYMITIRWIFEPSGAILYANRLVDQAAHKRRWQRARRRPPCTPMDTPPSGEPISASPAPETRRAGTGSSETGGQLTQPHAGQRSSQPSAHAGTRAAKPSGPSTLTPRSTWLHQRMHARQPQPSATLAHRYAGGPHLGGWGPLTAGVYVIPYYRLYPRRAHSFPVITRQRPASATSWAGGYPCLPGRCCQLPCRRYTALPHADA
jgi:hypothetical protein